jgi:predicted sulfurtransferase
MQIILFYKYIYLENPANILQWQKDLCQKLALKGRVILAHEGINATLQGEAEKIDHYKKEMSNHLLFGGIDFKESTTEHGRFPRLRVVVKKEIVNIGLDPATATADQGGIHLEPAQAHELLAQKNKDLVIIDCRNPYESAIGTIPGALRPEIQNFRDFPAYVDNNLDKLKEKEVLMYCTGGIRCERASAYVALKGVAKKVYQIKGGIHRYVEQFPNGFFKGKNYVFDGRVALKVTDDILGSCYICHTPCDDYTNCLRAACNRHFICCAACLEKYQKTCSTQCLDLITNGHAQKRPEPTKIYESSHSNKCSAER